MTAHPSYRFGDFVVSPRRRQLLRNGQPLPLIPRYFDLLVLLIERRQAAVSRQEIFDTVWADVIVSDGALSQAVRTLRRALGDDSREPLYIRTVSRHGYSFIYADLVEEPEAAVASTTNGPRASDGAAASEPAEAPPSVAAVDELIDRLIAASDANAAEDPRDIAEQLHLLGTATAVERLMARADHAKALAVLRDVRWSVPGAGDVPLAGQPEGLAAAWALIRLRAADALGIARPRWTAAASASAVGGALAGAVGGLALMLAPTSSTPLQAVPVLAGLGALAGAIGAAGVAGGISAAEALARSWRTAAIVSGGALGGLAIGLLAHFAVRGTLEGLFGLQVPVGGPVEGLGLGAAVGLGYGLTTRSLVAGGLATPTGSARWRTALAAGLAGAAVAVLLSSSGYPLVGGIINAVAQASRGSQVPLTPLGLWIGDPLFGPVTRAMVAVLEGGVFGFSLTWGLTRRRWRPAQMTQDSPRG